MTVLSGSEEENIFLLFPLKVNEFKQLNGRYSIPISIYTKYNKLIVLFWRKILQRRHLAKINKYNYVGNV